MIRILSLGAGVQSSTVLLMSIKGELPKIDHAIFADTGWEPKEVYDHLDCLELQCIKAGIPLHRVKAGNIRRDMAMARTSGDNYEGRWASMPLYVKGDGIYGMIKRQCTKEYKIEPIERFIKQTILGLKKGARLPKEPVVEQWYGISVDEAQRMRDSDAIWRVNQYPLCGFPKEYLPRPYSRADCIEWLSRNWKYEVVRSACLGCPFQSDSMFRRLFENDNYRNDIIDFDRSIRKAAGMRGESFIHRSMKPIDEVDFSTAEDKGQLNMFNNECQGMCGV